MRFKGLDLNLLVALDVLLETHSVSRAAERTHLSQAAMSAALGRLRQYFGDALLVVHGKRMYLTAYAESLIPQVRECLRQVEGLIATSPSFDPATSQRTFRLIASDYVAAVLVVPLTARLVTAAPHVRIELLLPSDRVHELIEDGDADLLLTPQEYISPDLPADFLYEERHVVVGWRDNPLVKRPISEHDLLRAGHVGVTIGNLRTASFGDRQLEQLGKVRHVEILAPSFTMVPWLLLGTPRLAIMHERLAVAMAAHFAIAHVELPFEFPPMREMAQFHSARARDEGLSWLRQELATIAGGIVRPAGASSGAAVPR